MSFFQTLAVLLTATALAGYVNERWFRLPTTAALMGFALLASALGIGLSHLGLWDLQETAQFVRRLDFSRVLLNGLLSLLLFAGAMHFDITELRTVRSSVIVLATLGVVISTFVVGILVWFGALWLGVHLPLTYALVFGALISPTDPIAVLAVLKKAQVSKKLYAGIGGESLLNDGVSLVLFLVFLGLATHRQQLDATFIASELAWTIFGGAALGVVLGLVTSYLLKTVDDYKVEVLLTLALATGGYVVAGMAATSGPIAIVIAGLIIGGQGRVKGAEAVTRRHLYLFWELMDEILNAILFLLMGLVLVLVTFSPHYLQMGIIAIPALLLARLISVGLPITCLRFFRTIEKGTIRLLTWGGLRGGISIAMVLSLPPVHEKDLLLTMTYVVVVFSVLVQGLTFPRFVEMFAKKG